MAKGKDPFEIFRNATLSGTPSIKDAISPDTEPAKESKPSASAPIETIASASSISQKNIETIKQEQVSFFINKELKKAVGLLKYELDVQLKDLYEEAIIDLLKKYHKL